MADITYDHPLLLLTEKQVLQVREHGEMDMNRLKESIKTVLDWCSKEEHLQAAVPYLAKTRLIERRLLSSKGSIEDCKKRIDMLLTTRNLMPEICLKRTTDEFKTIQSCLNYVTMPKLCPTDLSRVIIAQFKEKMDDFTLLAYFRYAFYIGEYRVYDDYSISERYVLDLQHASFSFVAKINPILLKKVEILAQDGYGTKVKGIHILNAPSFVDKIVFILKQALKPKVAARLHVHNSYEEFHKHVPKEILPKDYGGDEKSCDELTEAWNNLMSTEVSQRKIKDLDHLVADETRRSNSKFNEEYLGMPGSFRKLDVD